jgi:hypothetical protein
VLILSWALLRIRKAVKNQSDLKLNVGLMRTHTAIMLLNMFADYAIWVGFGVFAKDGNIGAIGILNIILFTTLLGVEIVTVVVLLSISNMAVTSIDEDSDSEEEVSFEQQNMLNFSGAERMKIKRNSMDEKRSNSSSSSIGVRANMRHAIFQQFFESVIEPHDFDLQSNQAFN